MKRWIANRLTKEETRRYSIFGAILLVVIILIAVIVIANQSSQGEKGTETVTETTAEETLDSRAMELLSVPLAQDSIPEINALMERYFQARISSDPEVIREVFDARSLTDEDAISDKMGQQTEYIESYQNIVCYTKAGLEPDSYVVFVKFDIKFYKTDTLAPSLLWCYVKKSENQTYRIVEIPDEKTARFIAEVEKTDEVTALAKSVNQALEEAVASDGKLASIYNILRAGVTEEESQTQAESSIESETVPETQAESQTEDKAGSGSQP